MDVHGNFIKYHGYTIICKLESSSVLRGLESVIRNTKTLSKYIVPTPSSSYHMTITGLQNPTPDRLLNLKDICKENSKREPVMVNDVYFGKTAGIFVGAADAHYRLRRRLLESMGVDQIDDSDFWPHITIGYFRGVPIKIEDRDEYSLDITMVKKYIYTIFPQLNTRLFLKPAKVCEFHDMQEFIDL